MPGVNQFDFYQPIHHFIFMVEKNGTGRHQYRDVRYVEKTTDKKVILHLADGQVRVFPDDGSWDLYDLSMTHGWNNDAVLPPMLKDVVQQIGDAINAAPAAESRNNGESTVETAQISEKMSDKRQVLVNLVRRRPSERSVWVDSLYLTVDKSSFEAVGNARWNDPDFVLKKIRKMIDAWMQTKEGWLANCVSCHDFNWGDLVENLPLCDADTVLSGTNNINLGINARVDIEVDQDELLAPRAVPVDVYKKNQGQEKLFGTAVVDFTDGTIYDLNSDRVLPQRGEFIRVQTQRDSFFAIWYGKIGQLS